MAESLMEQVRRLQTGLVGLLSSTDLYEHDKPVQKLVASVKRDLADLRLDIRDFEFADTLTDQQKSARAAHKRLDKLQKQLLALSEHGLLGAADVAEYGARLDTVRAGV